jgi:ABC-type glycerol-3-phosphate transport system substrate-binding protein
MKKVVSVLMIVLLLSATVFAAGTKEAKAREIVVATWAGDPFESAWKDKAKEFEKDTGIKVVIDAVPWENLREKTALEIANKTGSYDVIYVHPSWFGAFQKNGYLIPVDRYADASVLDTFVPNLLENYTVDGKVYGLPDFITTQVIAYRKDIFEEKNLTPPSSWSELLEVCKSLAGNKDYVPITFPARKGGTLSSVFNGFLISNGGWYFDSKGNVIIDSQPAIETAQMLAKLFEYTPKGLFNVHWDENARIASGGKAAMAVIATPNSAWLEDETKSLTAGKWGYIPIVSDKGNPGGLVDDYCWSVAVDSKNIQDAGKFVKFITSTESQIYFTEKSSTCGATKEYYANKELQASQPVLVAMQETLKNSKHAPSWSTWGQEQEILEVSLQQVMTGDLTAEEAMKKVKMAML